MHQEHKPDLSERLLTGTQLADKFALGASVSAKIEVTGRYLAIPRKRVNVRVIFARSCQSGNPCANKVPHQSNVRVRFSQWPFGKWRALGPSLRGSNEEPTFCALKYRLIVPGFCCRFYPSSLWTRSAICEIFDRLYERVSSPRFPFIS